MLLRPTQPALNNRPDAGRRVRALSAIERRFSARLHCSSPKRSEPQSLLITLGRRKFVGDAGFATDDIW
jgi:hypothetical protein